MTLKHTLYGSVMVALLLSGSLLAADTKATDEKKAPVENTLEADRPLTDVRARSRATAKKDAKKYTPEQIRYQAIMEIQDSLTEIKKHLDQKKVFLSEYLKDKNLTAAYRKSGTQASAAVKKIPGTLEQAITAMTEDMKKHGSNYQYVSTPANDDELERQSNAQAKMTAGSFDRILRSLRSADRQKEFLHQQGQWDEFMDWVDAKVDKEGEARQGRTAKARVKAKEDQTARLKAEQENRYFRSDRRWNRGVQMYELGTERTYADNSKYSNDRYDNGWSRGRRGGRGGRGRRGGWGSGYTVRGSNGRRSGAKLVRGRYKNTTALQIYGSQG
jgi:hypothetical protein